MPKITGFRNVSIPVLLSNIPTSAVNVNPNFQFADGDLGAYGDVKDAYMKQKHRMIWERRHGKIGSGMKATDD